MGHKIFCRSGGPPYRHRGKYIVADDGTGTHSFSDNYSGSCLSKTSKNGMVTYSHAVLEAKLVTDNGFCISLASEWMENPEGIPEEFNKQDCELKAFKRLAAKLKELYPKLPIILVADALYANIPVMEICNKNQWDYLLVLKEGSQKDLNEEISLRPDKKIQSTKRGNILYLKNLELGSHSLSWLRCQELDSCFCWLTNIEIKSFEMATALQKVGRMRWNRNVGPHRK